MSRRKARAVDLFAGFGGLTAGAEQAGVDVLWAANHWPLAVEVHALNHAHTEHVCQDLRQADWTALPADLDLMLAAPACQGHSTASQPRRRRYHDALRATAWAVCDCAESVTPRALVIENVPSFRRWPRYHLWRQVLESIGYTLTEHVVRASHHGVAQRRDRLFVCGTLNGRAVELSPRTEEEPPFGGLIEWDAPDWRRIDKARDAANERIRRAQRRCGPVCLVQHTSDHQGVRIEEPIRTITTKDQWIVVDGQHYRPLTPREYARAMGFADSYQLPDASRADVVRGLGNAVCPPVARDVVAATLEAAA